MTILLTFDASICLRGSLRFNSVLPNKQTFKFPSAVRRRRLHDPQKFSLIDVMNPIRPKYPKSIEVLAYYKRFDISCNVALRPFVTMLIYLVLPTPLLYHSLRLLSPCVQNLETQFLLFESFPYSSPSKCIRKC